MTLTVAVLVALRRFRRLSPLLTKYRRLVDIAAGALVNVVGFLGFASAVARLTGLFTIGVV